MIAVGDSEAQISALEYTIPNSTKFIYLALYFTLNLVLTLYNKVVLGNVREKNNDGLLPPVHPQNDGLHPSVHEAPQAVLH